MKPIAIFQHTRVGAPGTITDILQSLGQTVEIIPIMDGAPVPPTCAAYGGLVFMGGSMGVHDALPWIEQEIALMREADARGLPLAGHCLGSQLLATALGGRAFKHRQAEIGWQSIQTGSDAVSREWWQEFAGQNILTFQWHQDTFDMPAGTAQIATAGHCDSQAFIAKDRHLLVQSHFEMTPELIHLSFEKNGHQLLKQFGLKNPSVSDPDDLLKSLDSRTATMKSVLCRLYARWVKGISHT
ncbi:MAG TPA: type 1 glutamine amidotransferase [Castellaniella sp.]|nr:type 1 glutamine amidotransferase [Castellaniella sp.]